MVWLPWPERKSTEPKQAAKNAAKHVAAAKDRISRLERGEDIGGTTKIDIRKLFGDVGVTDSDIRHYGVVSRIHELGAEQEYLDAIQPDERRERQTARRILRCGRAAKARSTITDRLALTRALEGSGMQSEAGLR
jgi:hypothetical protein